MHTSPDSPHELYAREFAAQLLMPTEAVDRVAVAHAPCDDDALVVVVARRFEVPEENARDRLRALGHIN